MTQHLQRRLTPRHITFMALGMAIGAGLFLGSADAIKLAGPSVLFAYMVGGVMIFIIMRALGEMTVRAPVPGSFAVYAQRYLGPFAGYATGWNYWLLMVGVGMAEATAVGAYMQTWFPDWPRWIWVLASVVMIGGLNLLTVKIYGEMEFWFTLIKVVTVLAMIAGGLAIIFLGWGNGGQPTGLSNLWSQGGWFPHGVLGMVMALPVVVFSFGGVETVGIAAGEAAQPERTIPRAVNSVLWRILIFYVGALFVIMAIYPWTGLGEHGSPFVTTFAKLGIPQAAGLINFVVITAALSGFNSTTFSGSRMLYSLACKGQAPAALGQVNGQGVPVRAILATLAVLLLAVLLNYLLPAKVFGMMMSILSFNTVWTWTMVLLAHYSFRRQLRERGEAPSGFRLRWWPFSGIVCLAFFGFVVVMLGVNSETRVALYVGAAWIFLLSIAYHLCGVHQRMLRMEPPVAEGA
ncbi:amino acid/polyamine/organocation transporter, APC superfamily [Dyella jiangningensis]|uniref:amino acid permease n=1 Tax=Dyella sp. AtDHG13 TaxID=1938897 RepID=UPI0008826687|nr:amino acid permease [Dyella sp. AtDHG13]PXV58337.1 amino acid/polyamine/organocation transporter (APC superfamily) [Dyella sp. AtDHG13]SDK06603.1 amino acid/polyamine/organocation transporter, APC superfamily [Dyella jiangningensis]